MCLPDNSALTNNDFTARLLAAGCPQGVVESLAYQNLREVIEHQKTAGVVYAGQLNTAQMLARSPAAREGLLAQLIVLHYP